MALTFDTETIGRITDLLAGSRKTVIVSHTNPDGDAAGSVLGLYHWLRANFDDDRRYTLLLPHPCPSDATYLPGAELLVSASEALTHCEQCIADADLIVGVDFNNPKRVVPMDNALIASKARKILFDHHHQPDRQAFDAIVSVPDLSSTCELLYWAMTQMRGSESVTFETARCLYHGMNTDTGGFAFSNEDPSLYEALAGIMRHPIGAADVHNRIVNSYSINKMRLLAYLLDQKLKIFEAEQFAYLAVSEAEWRSLGCIAEDLEGIVNYTLMMKQIAVGVMVKETEGKVRLSFRSKNDFDVNRFAATHFGGGGHTKAAGATSQWGFEETVKRLEDTMLPALREHVSRQSKTENNLLP